MILESLYILFKGDTSDLKKKRIEAEKETNAVNKKLTTTRQASDAIGVSLGNVAKQFAAIALSALGVGSILNEFKKTLGDSIDLSQFSRNTQTDIAQVDALGQAFKVVGGNAQEFQANLQALSKHTGGSPQLALTVLPGFIKAFRELNYLQAHQVGQNYGFSDKFVAFLRQPGLWEGVYQQTLKLDKSLKEMQPDILQFDKAWVVASITLRSLFLDLERDSLPAMTRFAEAFTRTITYIDEAVHGIEVGSAFTAIDNYVEKSRTKFNLLAATILNLTEVIKAFGDVGKYVFSGQIGTDFGGYIFKHGGMHGQQFYDKATAPNEIHPNKLVDYISKMNTSPFAQGTVFSGGSTGDKSICVHIDDINIATQATDADVIGQDIGKSLRDGIGHLANHFNTGILA